MANVVEYRFRLDPATMGPTKVGLLDGIARLVSPLQLPTDRMMPKVQCTSITISDRIPNIFDASPWYAFDNTKLVLYFVQIAPPIVHTCNIQLERGLYIEVTEIAAAINAAINTNPAWQFWADPEDPGLIFTANAVIDRIIITLDPSKLKPAYSSFSLNLQKAVSGTDLATTLGFSQAAALMSSGFVATSFVSDIDVKMDAQGTQCEVESSLITNRRMNSSLKRTLALIPFVGKTSASDNVWPSGGLVSPQMVYEGPRTITSFDVQVKTSDGKPMLFMSGGIDVVVAFTY